MSTTTNAALLCYGHDAALRIEAAQQRGPGRRPNTGPCRTLGTVMCRVAWAGGLVALRVMRDTERGNVVGVYGARCEMVPQVADISGVMTWAEALDALRAHPMIEGVVSWTT